VINAKSTQPGTGDHPCSTRRRAADSCDKNPCHSNTYNASRHLRIHSQAPQPTAGRAGKNLNPMPDHICMDADPDDNLELLGGMEKREIVIVDHNPDWAQKFTTERNRIVYALGPRARRVDHIGSTAVPGLPERMLILTNASIRADLDA
jgi:hypothetical protein